MNNTLIYKDYVGSIEFSDDDQLLCGQVLGIKSLIMYEGANPQELIEDFHEAVDEYLESCTEKGVEPEIAYKGNINVRLKPDTHRKAAIYAINHNMSLNSVIENSVGQYLLANS